jgi:glycosyltransferase involved in cell wall biosynthesis
MLAGRAMQQRSDILKVMVLGIRGIPDIPGGVETHAQNLYPRIAGQGWEVELLVRTPFVPKGRRGLGEIKFRRIWCPRTRGLEAFVHSMLGVIYACLARPDLLHIHAVGPAIVTPLARLFGLRVVVTHHGPDYERAKWKTFARWVLRAGERLGMIYSNARIAVSAAIADLIRSRYSLASDLIHNGVEIRPPASASAYVRSLGIVPRRYVLQVSRIVPEKRQLDLIRAYRALQPTDWKLVLVGGLEADAFSNQVQAEASSAGVVMTGSLTGDPLHELYSHAGVFVLPSAHEGLPIAMLEALSYGLPVLASDIPANLEVGLEKSQYFPLGDVSSLSRALRAVVDGPGVTELVSERSRQIARRYDWDRITDSTLQVYERVTSN